MTSDDFVERFGPVEEFVLTFDPFLGPNVTDLETKANYIVSEEDYNEIMILFRSIYDSKK